MELDTHYVHLLIKDNILIGTYKNEVHITLDIAKEIVYSRLSFTGGKKMPCIILGKGVVTMSKPAREFLSSEEGIQGLTASAIIVNSHYSSFLGNFFLMVNKTKMPVKIFSDVFSAEKWLQKFIE